MDQINLWKIPNQLDKILKECKEKLIITRFPPEPSGYLHIGHAKAIFINYIIAKKYGGKMIMRYDDTNPLKESSEFENAIKEDVASLGITPDLTTYSSDYFEQIIKYAEYLLLNGKAYIDDTVQELMREEREKSIESIHRNKSIENNIREWTLMKQGVKIDACVRIKMNMKSLNAACRDPTIFRCINQPHHKCGTIFKVYPTYDFACPIVDSLEGITHVFRSVEFSERDEQYKIIISELGIRQPLLFSYGKVKFEGVVLSKRKIKDLIEKGVIQNWSDPRLFTLRGLFNRGLCLDALKQFISKIGFSKNTTNMTQDMLWSINRKVVDKIATRYTCLSRSYKEIKVSGLISNSKEIPKFIKNQSLGKRMLDYSDTILIDPEEFETNEEITLMNWGNAFVNIDKFTLNIDGDFRLTSKKVPWISKNTVEVIIHKYIGYEPCICTYFIGEAQLLNIKKGDYVQFIKMKYYICSNIDTENRKVSFIELD
jgi:glutamyl-tRNA synthetase